eukprot:16800-Eustigmatos_ZCMA.PRE.1
MVKVCAVTQGDNGQWRDAHNADLLLALPLRPRADGVAVQRCLYTICGRTTGKGCSIDRCITELVVTP